MPLKSKTNLKFEPRFLTKTGILREYGISDQTLRRLADSLGFVKLSAVSEHGKVLYEIDEISDLSLRLGKMCPFSVALFRPPMLRFILLSVLTGSSEDALTSLDDRKIGNRSIGHAEIEAYHEYLVKNVPPILTDVVQQRRAPASEEEANVYGALLAVIGVSSVYQAPDVLEQFYFHDESMLHFVNQVCWTHSASTEIKASVINQGTGLDAFTSEGLLLYAHMFHDSEFMRESDMLRYSQGLHPRIRNAYRLSRGMTTEQWLVESQLAQDTVIELMHLSRQYKSRIRELMASADPNARVEGARLLTAALKLDDHIGKSRPESIAKNVPEHLKEITPEPYKFDTMFQLPAELKPREGNQTDVG